MYFATKVCAARRLRSRQVWHRAVLITATTMAIHDPLASSAFSTSQFAYFGTSSTTTILSCPHKKLSQNCRYMSSHSSSDDDSRSDRKDISPLDFIFNRAPKEDHPILDRTLAWVKGAVIGLNFCPFAERPYNSKRLFSHVIQGTNQTEILSQVLAECLIRQRNPGTSLMICPDLFPTNFYSFLEVYNMLQDGVLVDNELTEDIQIAPFHPQFQFEGSGEDGIDNLTNRSPYPIFHILREEEVRQAVDALDQDASKVWKRNVKLLEELNMEFDRDQMEKLATGERLEDEQVLRKVKEILKRIKKEK